MGIREDRLVYWSIAAAAYGLLKKRSKLFSIGSNNAVLEFFLEGLPDVVEKLLDSKKVCIHSYTVFLHGCVLEYGNVAHGMITYTNAQS